MKIIGFQAEAIKRVRAVRIDPTGNVIELTGKNEQGKSSILDAIWWCFSGKKPIDKDPIRAGEEKATIQIKLGDNGVEKYTVTRRFKRKPDGDFTTSLVVEGEDGFRASDPQDVLNKLIGALSFDPVAFSRMKPADQIMALHGLVPDFDFEAHDKQNQADFQKRQGINRIIRDNEGRLEGLKFPDDTPDQPISLSDLMAEMQEGINKNKLVERFHATTSELSADGDFAKERADAHQRQVAELAEKLEAARRILEEKRGHIEEVERALAAHLEQTAPETVDINAIRDRTMSVEAVNANVRRKIEARETREEIKVLTAESQELSDAITKRTNEARAAIAKADLALEGLELTETDVLLDGHPFAQASDARRLRASIAVAAAANPSLRVLRVRDGSILDSEAWQALSDFADEKDMQIWVETVESARPTAIVIEDGMIAQHREAAE